MVDPAPPVTRLSKSSLKDLSESSILRSFDLVIYAHLVYLYFLEYAPNFRLLTLCSNSTIRLLIRFIFQNNILSPKSPLSAFASVDLSLRKATILLLACFGLGFIPHLFFGGIDA